MTWLTFSSLVTLLMVCIVCCTSGAVPQRFPCPIGWHHYGTFCYTIGHQELNWFDAEVTCKSVGGHLATVHSSSEDNFITSLLRDESVTMAWIGLSDAAVEGQFVWSSNAQIPRYTNWSPGEPNNMLGKEDCAMKWDSNYRWNDSNCFNAISFVCKTAAGESSNEMQTAGS